MSNAEAAAKAVQSVLIKNMNSNHDLLLVKLFTEALGHQFQGNQISALIAYKRIQRQFPDFVDAWTNASVALYDMGRYYEALDVALRAVELDAENPSAYCALANACQSLGDFNGAVVNFRKALEICPTHFPALTNLAELYANQGYFAEALDLYSRAIQVQPSNSVAWENRGYTRMYTLDMAGAEADLKHALELDGNNTSAHRLLGIVYLLQYRYLEAWSVLNKIPPPWWNVTKRDFGKPHWVGEPLNGRTLLVYTDHRGFGDAIQFARFFPLRNNNGSRVLLLIHEPLKRLLTGLPGVDALLIDGEPLPPFDLVAPLMDLLVILNIDSPEIPPPLRISSKSRPLAELDRTGFKIGLVWAANHALRSINPRLLDELADIPGVAWYGLQLPRSDEPPNLPGFIDMSPHMGDFMDTAQIAEQMDLIVTVDTSMAHLAGSLGVPAFVLLPYLPDWRWGLNSQHTPWYPYPEYLLIRQSKYDCWQRAISLLKERIIELT